MSTVLQAAGLQFVRAEGFVFGHLADEGWVEACAGTLLRFKSAFDMGFLFRFRKEIGAEDVCIVCDIKKKHSAHAVTADVRWIGQQNIKHLLQNLCCLLPPSIEETAKAAEFFRADGLIVTGNSTGDPASPQEVVIMLMTMMIVPMMMMMIKT